MVMLDFIEHLRRLQLGFQHVLSLTLPDTVSLLCNLFDAPEIAALALQQAYGLRQVKKARNSSRGSFPQFVAALLRTDAAQSRRSFRLSRSLPGPGISCEAPKPV